MSSNFLRFEDLVEGEEVVLYSFHMLRVTVTKVDKEKGTVTFTGSGKENSSIRNKDEIEHLKIARF